MDRRHLSLQRQRVKRLIAQLEVEHPDIKNSMLRALGNVAPRHLLDRRGRDQVQEPYRRAAGGL